MHIAGGGELASEGAAEGVRGVDDGAAPAGSWQGWPSVEGVRAQELALPAVHRERLVPVTSLVRQSLVLRLFKPTLGLMQQGKNNCAVCVPRDWCYYGNYCS